MHYLIKLIFFFFVLLLFTTFQDIPSCAAIMIYGRIDPLNRFEEKAFFLINPKPVICNDRRSSRPAKLQGGWPWGSSIPHWDGGLLWFFFLEVSLKGCSLKVLSLVCIPVAVWLSFRKKYNFLGIFVARFAVGFDSSNTVSTICYIGASIRARVVN